MRNSTPPASSAPWPVTPSEWAALLTEYSTPTAAPEPPLAGIRTRLDVLVADHSSDVRVLAALADAIQQKLGLDADGDSTSLRSLRYRIVMNSNCPSEWLRWAAQSDDVTLLLLAAKNASLPESLATVIADTDPTNARGIRAALVGNSSLADGFLPRLLPAENTPLTAGVVHLLTGLGQRLSGPQRQTIANKLWEAAPSTERDLFLAEFSTNPRQVGSLCWDDDPSVRNRALRNPAAPESDRVAAGLLGAHEQPDREIETTDL